MIPIYFLSLFIAPQLWLEPFVGIRVDLIIYPLWFVYLLTTGKINRLFELRLQDKLFLTMVIWTVITVLLNDTHGLSVKIIVDYVKWFILYMLFIATIDDFNSFKKTIKWIIFFVMVLVVEGIQHKLSADGIGWAGQTLGWVDPDVLKAGGTGRTQWMNIFDGPGVFCVVYTVGLPFVLQYLDKHYPSKLKFYAILMLLPLLLATWYTGSRGGFLATLGVLALYTVTRYAKKLDLSLNKIAGIALIVLIGIMAAPKHLTEVKDQSNSAQHRVDMWMQGVEMVEQNPILGIGRGNFSSYTGSLIAHNSAIENMGEMGLPGLFLWVALIYFAFKNIFVFSSLTSDLAQKSYVKGLALCLVGYLISSMFVTLEEETFYFLLAMSASLGRMHDTEVLFEQKDLVIISGVILIFLIALKIFVIFYY